VYPFKNSIKQIKNNIQDGSLQILNETIEAISNYLGSEEFSVSVFNIQLKELSQTFPDFSVLQHFIAGINTSGNTNKELSSFISNYKTNWGSVDREISNHFLKNINVNDSNILLHSNSKTIQTLFEEIAKRKIRINVFQTESYPGREGVTQADYLIKLGFKVVLIKDDDVEEHLKSIDMFLIGADRIEQNFIINKIGSIAIAKLFVKKGKPVFVLADSRKIILENLPAKGELFEKVPRELVTIVITENKVNR